MTVVQLTKQQIEHWRLLYQEELVSTKWVTFFKELDENRVIDQKEMLELLNDYLAAHISTEKFRATFDQKTRKDWNTFGFKGMSGAMFLNILVKHISDEKAVANQLRSVLPLPINEQDGHKRMQNFIQFLEHLISTQQVSKKLLQPSRTSFFVSAWWHLQATEQWPVFYPRTRQLLEVEGLYTASQNPIDDYFTFRDCYLSLAHTLGLTSWQLEHLCVWKRENEGVIASSEVTSQTIKKDDPPIAPENIAKVHEEEEHQPAAPVLLPKVLQEVDDEEPIVSASAHTHIQLQLAKIGRKLGCDIWIAANDHNKVWNNERLGDLSLKKFPPIMDADFQQIVSLIDVLWLKGAKVMAAFEVEHTTSIYSGLLRMSDLVALYPNIIFSLYIVTPNVRLDKVRRELSRPTFQALELHKRCGFFSEERLLQDADNIMRWASHPSAIEKLAERVDNVES